MIAAQQLNLFPANGGLSPYYSPNVILTGKPLDYNKHFQIPFGSYVQANHEPNLKNTTAPRTLDAIYLQPTGNDKLSSLVIQLTRKDSRRVRPVDLLVEISCGDSIRL